MVRTLHALTAAAAFIALTACTVHKQADAPPLTGPSTSATQVNVTVSPDILTQDGASQSLVTIAAFGPFGQPLANLQVRADMAVGGVITDFGRLSARNLVTDSAGHATVIYTAPPPPAIVLTTGTVVAIVVTPTNSGDAANSNAQSATIRLVPPGIIPAPVSPFVPSFTVPAVDVGDQAVFTARVVDSTGADVTSQIASFQWNFGDGATASGRNVTHTFTQIGTFPVTLTITDALNRTNSVTQSMTIGQGQLPTATFVTSPASPVVNQTINFNASGSQPAPGHTIVDFAWTFGDGTNGSGAVVTHAYASAGSYTVTLQTTDDAGRKSVLAAQTIVVGTGVPVAQITISPPSGPVGTNFSFIGSQSTAAPGRTIVRYDWNFGDNTTGSGATTNHAYATKGTFTVTLVVTDDQGNTGIATATVTVS